jgi:hypothetical protein
MGFCVAAKQIQCSSVEKKCLLLYYAIRSDENGRFFDSNFTISAETGVSDSTITRSNQAWHKLGLLTVTAPPKDSNHSNDYQLNLAAWKELAAKVSLEDKATRLKIEHQLADKARHREWRERIRKENESAPRKPLNQRLKDALAD